MNVFKLIEDNGLTLHGDIEHFAELIRQEEREACAKILEADANARAVEAKEWVGLTDDEVSEIIDREIHKAITALRERLAQPEQEPVAWMCSDFNIMHRGYSRFSPTRQGEWNIPLYTAPSKQEPVAWMHNFIEGGISIGKKPTDLNRHPDRWTALYKDPTPCKTCQALAMAVMNDQTYHEKIIPKRQWVGLTAYEIQEIYSGNQHWGNFASAIEAKLKEKNT